MGYNLQDVSGNPSGGLNAWAFTLDLTDPSASTVTGDFSMVGTFGGVRESSSPYVFTTLEGGAFGTLGFNTSTGTYTFTVNRTAVIQSGTDQIYRFSVQGTDGGTSYTDTVTVNILICVTRGTRIETERGEVPVELLRIGDLVRTKDGAFEPVRWIGSRKVSAEELRQSDTLRPIVIQAEALGKGLPRRTLAVSPNHRILLSDWRAELLFGEPEVLAPAKALVNDKTIRRDSRAVTVEYFHVLFDTHQIILTEGLPTESFHPGVYSMSELDEEVREELVLLFPQLARPDGYGKTARIALRPWEAHVLLEQDNAGGAVSSLEQVG
ncbi:Hint domain-containing protein [Anianabacter salinae]|uniref:Hint domain-containing protein n=1 Tax=Anianabacter salinae TaxID=2851023 RepID=UPI00225E24BB|nr:Hint domain-containing protein [Anianabacter salinae]MBV0913530.1 Hint domain-containing protein [Anianabacter salinae]